MTLNRASVRLIALLTLLTTASLVQAGDDWCGASVNRCGSLSKGLSDLSCGFCRDWPLSSSIANNILRVKRLEGGALPGDSSNYGYIAQVSLNDGFDTDDGSVWSLLQIPSTVPHTIDGGFWASPDNQTIYAYGGRAADPASAPNDTNQLPQFDIAVSNWTIPSGNPISIIRLDGGVDVNVPLLQVAYYLGGYQSDWTTQQVTDGSLHFANSMIEFNTTTGSSRDIDAKDILPVQYGALTYLPYGADGILVYFGGESPDQQVVSNCSDCAVNDWNYVHIFDIATNSWHQQSTTGTVRARSEFCTSTMYDESTKSWQIWSIGGREFSALNSISDVSILSIPSFQWFNASPATSRMSTSCQGVGSQVFVIGGRTQNTQIGGSNYDRLAYIYDVNKQAVVTSYDPQATPYTAPSSIRSVLATSSTPSSWANPVVQSIFLTTANAAATVTSATSSAKSTVSPSTAGIPAGAIAGIVIGVVLLLAILGLAAWLMWRRRQRRVQEGQQGISEMSASEPIHRVSEKRASMAHQQLPAEQMRWEMEASTAASEMPSEQTYHELPASRTDAELR